MSPKVHVVKVAPRGGAAGGQCTLGEGQYRGRSLGH